HNPGYLFKPSYWKIVSADRIVSHLTSIRRDIRDHWSAFGVETFLLKVDAPTLEAVEYMNHIGDFYDMTVRHAYYTFLEAIGPVQQEIDAEEIDAEEIEDGLLKKLVQCYSDAIAVFDTTVKHHRHSICKAKRNELGAKCSKMFSSFICEQAPWNLMGRVVQLRINDAQQEQESLIQERIQREVEERTKEAKLANEQAADEKLQQLEEIERLRMTIAEQNAEISKNTATIAKKDAEIRKQKALVAEKDTEIHEQEAEIGKQQAEIETLKAKSGEKDKTISTLEIENNVLSELVADRDEDIGELRIAVSEYKVAIQGLQKTVDRKVAIPHRRKATMAVQEEEVKTQQVAENQPEHATEKQATESNQDSTTGEESDEAAAPPSQTAEKGLDD
ncbi:hypothetical protein THASP1DRAFT_23166, partial [Thamnocephalis sphaerospora]